MDYDFNGKRVFLSGPMTSKPDWNREAFAQAEERCYELGAKHVFNPALTAPEDGEPTAAHEQYMNATLHELTRWWRRGHIIQSRPFYDVLVMLPGWGTSKGANREYDVAESIGVPIVFAEEVL